jgi:hypothetical protein
MTYDMTRICLSDGRQMVTVPGIGMESIERWEMDRLKQI